MPPVGAQSADTASGETFGSRRRSSAWSMISTGTPFFPALSTRSSRPLISSSLNAKTSEPLRLNGTFSSLQAFSNILLPRTLNFALFVPGFASKPACTIALLALDAPSATSDPASSTATFRFQRLSSRAVMQPTTPAPITITSSIFLLPC